MKLELKHITPYLPYRLMVLIIDVPCEVEGVDLHQKDTIIVERADYNLTEVKPILRPLSDLNKKIQIAEHYRTFLDHFNANNGLFEIDDELSGDTGYYGDFASFEEIYGTYQKLFEWHFDVFGLIEKGLAIDINTLCS